MDPWRWTQQLLIKPGDETIQVFLHKVDEVEEQLDVELGQQVAVVPH